MCIICMWWLLLPLLTVFDEVCRGETTPAPTFVCIRPPVSCEEDIPDR